MSEILKMIEEQRISNLDHRLVSICDQLGFEVAYNFHSAFDTFSAWITDQDSNSCKRYLQTTGGHKTLKEAFDGLLGILKAQIRGDLND